MEICSATPAIGGLREGGPRRPVGGVAPPGTRTASAANHFRRPFDGARRGRGHVRAGGRAARCSVVRTRDRVAGAGYACNARPDLRTVCRSFPKISSALSAKVCGGSRSAKKSLSMARDGQAPFDTRDGGLVHVSGRVNGGTIDTGAHTAAPRFQSR